MTALAIVANSRKLDNIHAGDLRIALAHAGFADAPWYEIEKGSAATGACQKALDHGADTVLVCGGDGTVRGAAQALANTDAALAVLPAGTANLFAHGLGLPLDAESVLNLILRGDRRTIDTGKCNDLRCSVMGGTGLDAARIAGADEEKDRLGTLAYGKAGVKNARDGRPHDAKVTVDGTSFYEGPATCVLVGNLGRLKGGLVAFPHASVTDGLLDVAVLSATGLREWAEVMMSAVRKKQDESTHVRLTQGHKIRVRLEKKQLFELDGGAKGRTRKLDFRVDPSSLVVCAPNTDN